MSRATAVRDRATITLVQLTERRDDATSVLDRMPRYFEEAVAAGSDLVAFPEYSLGRHITPDDPRVRRFFELARRHRVYGVAGLVEQVGERWATTAIIAGREGQLVGRYLKAHAAAGPDPYCWPPVPGNDEEARGILGDEFKSFELDFGRVGILQCYDGYFPEAWGCTSYGGAEVVLWLNGRTSMVQDAICISMAHCFACVVGANVSDGYNTGFAEPQYGSYVHAANVPPREESRLFPRIATPGDAAVTATIDLARLRRLRKHHRMQHQRRPELYTPLTRDVTMWRDYPDIPWTHPQCAALVNKARL